MLFWIYSIKKVPLVAITKETFTLNSKQTKLHPVLAIAFHASHRHTNYHCAHHFVVYYLYVFHFQFFVIPEQAEI